MEDVKIDYDSNKLTVIGNVDPVAIRDKVAGRIKRKVELVSTVAPPKKETPPEKKPAEEKPAEKKPTDEKKDEKKKEEGEKKASPPPPPKEVFNCLYLSFISSNLKKKKQILKGKKFFSHTEKTILKV